MIRTTAASIWYCLSWNTRSVVLTCSSTCKGKVYPGLEMNRKKQPRLRSEQRHAACFTVSFIWIWLILMRNSLCLKSLLKLKRSPSSTSFPRGFLLRTRALPQARDCSVRLSSPSSVQENRMAVTQQVPLPQSNSCTTSLKSCHLCQWQCGSLPCWIPLLHWTSAAPASGTKRLAAPSYPAG